MQFDGEKPDKITRGACACKDDLSVPRSPTSDVGSISIARSIKAVDAWLYWLPFSKWIPKVPDFGADEVMARDSGIARP